MPYQPIEKLDALMGGAVQEKFRVALAEVLSNIRDPNTKSGAKRTITLTLSITPNENRDVAAMDVQCKSKLAPAVPVQTTVYLSYADNGAVIATEKLDQIPGQIDMDGGEAPMPNIVTFESKK